MIAPRPLVFRPLVKGNEDSGDENVAAVYTLLELSVLFNTQRRTTGS